MRSPITPTQDRRLRTEAEQAPGIVEANEPAISGCGGHDQLYKTANQLVRSNLPLAAVWKLLLEYNLRCCPPWSKGELIHKLVDAYATTGVYYCEADLMARLPFELIAAEIDTDFIAPTASKTPPPRPKPVRVGFGPGTETQLQRLADLRGISVPGLRWAQDRGVLVFGFFVGMPVFGLTDCSGTVLEVRRLDGKTFPRVGNLSERKSHAVRGSSKRHPVGIDEARDFAHIVMVEGVPDFLAAHDLIQRQQSTDTNPAAPTCAPVAMLSGNVAIEDEALPMFKEKFVRIVYHNDDNGTGWKGARRWQQQIAKAGAYSCDFFHFNKITAATIKDLNEFIVAVDAGHLGPDQHALEGFWP